MRAGAELGPVRARARTLDRCARREGAVGAGWGRRGLDGLARLGCAVGVAVGRGGDAPADPRADQRLGAAALVGLLTALVIHPLPGAAMPLAVAGGEAWRRRRDAARARAELVAGLPDVVDLLALAVAGGATVRGAIDAVARHGAGPLAGCFADVLADVDERGARLADELSRLAGSLDPVAAPVLHPLVAAERYGVPLGPPLALVARDLRQVRRHRAEEAIRRVPVKLVFPLVCCILPAFVVLTVVPLLAASLSNLRS